MTSLCTTRLGACVEKGLVRIHLHTASHESLLSEICCAMMMFVAPDAGDQCQVHDDYRRNG